MSGEFPPGADEFVRKLGQAICRKRIVEGLTESEFAEATKLPLAVILEIEAGTYRLRAQTLVPIANALNTTPNELFELAAVERLETKRSV